LNNPAGARTGHIAIWQHGGDQEKDPALGAGP
jgi:hypothetical protein